MATKSWNISDPEIYLKYTTIYFDSVFRGQIAIFVIVCTQLSRLPNTTGIIMADANDRGDTVCAATGLYSDVTKTILEGVPDYMNRSAKVGKKGGSPIASEKECRERSKESAKKQKLIMANYSSRQSDIESSSYTGSVNEATPSIDCIIMSAEHARRDAWNQRKTESVAREAESKAREAESKAREAECVARRAEVNARTNRLMVSDILRLTRELRDNDLPMDVRHILESELTQHKLKWQARQADTSNKRQETTITEQEDGEDLGPASSAPGLNA